MREAIVFTWFDPVMAPAIICTPPTPIVMPLKTLVVEAPVIVTVAEGPAPVTVMVVVGTAAIRTSENTLLPGVEPMLLLHSR